MYWFPDSTYKNIRKGEVSDSLTQLHEMCLFIYSGHPECPKKNRAWGNRGRQVMQIYEASYRKTSMSWNYCEVLSLIRKFRSRFMIKKSLKYRSATGRVWCRWAQILQFEKRQSKMVRQYHSKVPPLLRGNRKISCPCERFTRPIRLLGAADWSVDWVLIKEFEVFPSHCILVR